MAGLWSVDLAVKRPDLPWERLEQSVDSTAEGALRDGDDLHTGDPCALPSDGARDERVMKGFGRLGRTELKEFI